MSLEMNKIEIFDTIDSLSKRMLEFPESGNVGFVPTMGALHDGHLSLVEKALEYAEIVVVSIFVNPTQFTNPDDLEKYPRTLEKDLELLATLKNVIVFTPTVDEIYPMDYREPDLDLGELDKVMEGKFRPGHFKGVVNVVKRLFDIVKPDFAFFGLKDFQQLAVIQLMVRKLGLDVKIIPCEIYREDSGLASSSRNVRLSEGQKQDALILYKALITAKQASEIQSPEATKALAMEVFESGNCRLEYFEIVDPETLMELKEWIPGARACIAAYCGDVRLIDNMEI